MRIALLIPDNRDEFKQYNEPEPRFGPAPTALIQGLQELSNCEFHIVCCTHKPLQTPRQIATNIFYHCLRVPRLGWRPTAYLGCVRAIRNQLACIRPDIVHGQGTERYCALAAVLSGLPNVITIHGNMRGMEQTLRPSVGTFYWCAARLESFSLHKTDGVFCNSAYTERMVRHLARKTWLVPNALRTIFFQPQPLRSVNSVAILLNIGTIAPHKRQVELLEILGRLFQVGHRFQVKFVGAGAQKDPYVAKFKTMMADAERQGYATHVAPESDNDLLRHFDEADALIHFPTEEAFGLVVAEGLARNLKFFGARTGGIPDIASDVEDAKFYDPNDWNGLTDGITHWIKQGHPRPADSASQMSKRYRPLTVASRHLEIYREVLSES